MGAHRLAEAAMVASATLEAVGDRTREELETEAENQRDAAEERVENAATDAAGGDGGGEIEGDSSAIDERTEMAKSAAQSSASGVSSKVKPPNFRGLFKISFGWLQMMSSLSVTFDIPWPPGFLSIQKFIFPIVNIDFMAAFSGFSCQVDTSFLQGFIVHMYIPIVVTFLVISCYVLARVYRVLACFKCIHPRYDMRQLSDRSVQVINFVIFLMYPGIASKVFRIWACTTYGDHRYR